MKVIFYFYHFTKVKSKTLLFKSKRICSFFKNRGLNLKLSLDILELMTKTKNNVLSVFDISFETHTRYSGVYDEEQKRCLKRF